jgi:hypothetical protein
MLRSATRVLKLCEALLFGSDDILRASPALCCAQFQFVNFALAFLPPAIARYEKI